MIDELHMISSASVKFLASQDLKVQQELRRKVLLHTVSYAPMLLFIQEEDDILS